MSAPTLSIVIPTYQREQVLLDTIAQLLDLQRSADEILIVDQTDEHAAETTAKLCAWRDAEDITWVKLEKPSIPAAMNKGLVMARSDIVLFLDDDIEVTSELVNSHLLEHQSGSAEAVVGRVVQSWEKPLGPEANAYPPGMEADPDAFLFNSGRRCPVKRVMAGNLSVNRSRALDIGGFDENFVRVAYRFEAEFADRMVCAGQRIVFQPEASIKHLKVLEGGTRTYGEHLTTIKPFHSVGRYYYLLIAGEIRGRWLKLLTGPIMAVKTRFHLFHPWWIPVTLIAETSGLLWALLLMLFGPSYEQSGTPAQGSS